MKKSVYRKGNKSTEMFVYKELEILASEDTKSIGRMGWLEARPLVERAPLMQGITVEPL